MSTWQQKKLFFNRQNPGAEPDSVVSSHLPSVASSLPNLCCSGVKKKNTSDRVYLQVV